MRRLRNHSGPALVIFALACAELGFAQSARDNGFGDVSFPTSCAPSVQHEFESAVAVLHSFWYEKAQAMFEDVARHDANCAMAYWGIAATKYHPLWGPNNVDDAGGKQAVARARELSARATPRERSYIEAIGAYYDAANQPAGERAQAFSHAIERVYETYPNDPEAAAFYALSLVATIDPEDLTYQRQKQAAQILLKIQAQHPNHPGAAHYLIHAYDNPDLAPLGLPAARLYAKIAPSIPHAEHMPAHIFTQVGLWREAIATDQNAIRSAERFEQEMGMHHLWDQHLHSMDFITYEYLQIGDDEAAKAILDQLSAHPAAAHGGSDAHANASIAARYAIERHDWKAAANLPVSPDLWPPFEAIVRYARGIGAARTGDVDELRQEEQRMETIESSLSKSPWRFRIRANRLVLAAWRAHLEGRADEALHSFETASGIRGTLQGMPPDLLPPQEAFADFLLTTGKPAQALEEYEGALRKTPKRFNGLAGAFEAAKLAGDQGAAREFARQLVDSTGAPGASRPVWREASQFLGSESRPNGSLRELHR